MKSTIPRGRTFVGTIIKAKALKTATLEFEWKKFVPKYERYLNKRTKLTVHNPDEIGAVKGDIVEVRECRPLSKTKSFIITKIMGKDNRFLEYEADKEEKLVKTEPKEK